MHQENRKRESHSPTGFQRRIFVRKKQSCKVQASQPQSQENRMPQYASRPRSHSKRKPIFGQKRRPIIGELDLTDTNEFLNKHMLPQEQTRHAFHRQQNSLDLSDIQRKSFQYPKKIDGLLNPLQFAYLGYKIQERISRKIAHS